jgi:hypothetical protein
VPARPISRCLSPLLRLTLARARCRRRKPPPPSLVVADSPRWDARGRSRGRHEFRDAKLDVRRPSPSPKDHQCAVTAWTEPAASELAPPAAPLRLRPPLHAPALGEHPHELPSISSTSRAACPNPRWPGSSAIEAGRAPLRPDLKQEEDLSLFAVSPLRNPITFSFVFVSCKPY